MGNNLKYVNQNLLPEENVISAAELHWWIYLPGGFVSFIGAILLIVAPMFGIPVIGYGFFILLKNWITSYTTEIAITNRRIVVKTGFIRRDTIELLHSKVESLSLDQNILERLLDFGTIVVHGTGGGKTYIPNIAKPLKFRITALTAIDSKN